MYLIKTGLNAFINLGLNYYPKFLSAVPFTPINGDRIFYNKPLEDIDDFFEILIKFLKKQNISSHHFNFISKITIRYNGKIWIFN